MGISYKTSKGPASSGSADLSAIQAVQKAAAAMTTAFGKVQKPVTAYAQHFGATPKAVKEYAKGSIGVFAPASSTPDLEFVAPQAVGTIETEYKNSEGVHQGSTQELVHPGLLMSKEEQPCSISVTGSRTVNLGNYESVKIGVTLTMPTPKADLNATYDYVTDWVSEKLQDAVSSFKKV